MGCSADFGGVCHARCVFYQEESSRVCARLLQRGLSWKTRNRYIIVPAPLGFGPNHSHLREKMDHVIFTLFLTRYKEKTFYPRYLPIARPFYLLVLNHFNPIPLIKSAYHTDLHIKGLLTHQDPTQTQCSSSCHPSTSSSSSLLSAQSACTPRRYRQRRYRYGRSLGVHRCHYGT